MITGAHVVIYSADAEADRALLRDVLELPFVDVGHGWLLFRLPPAEAAVHPSDQNDKHELWLMCDDVEAAVRKLGARGVPCDPIGAQWIEDGTADALASEVTVEMERRVRLAQQVFGPAAERPSFPASLHVWLPMAELDAERAAAHALRAGVEVTPPSAPIVDWHGLSGLRVCLGGVEDYGELERALKIVAEAVGGAGDQFSRAMM